MQTVTLNLTSANTWNHRRHRAALARRKGSRRPRCTLLRTIPSWITGENVADCVAVTLAADPSEAQRAVEAICWTATGRLAKGRTSHAATLLLNGNVLVADGYDYPAGILASTELYDVGLGFSASRSGHWLVGHHL